MSGQPILAEKKSHPRSCDPECTFPLQTQALTDPAGRHRGSHTSHEHTAAAPQLQLPAAGSSHTLKASDCSQSWRGNSLSQFPCLKQVLLLTYITKALNTFLDIRWKALLAYWNETAPLQKINKSVLNITFTPWNVTLLWDSKSLH